MAVTAKRRRDDSRSVASPMGVRLCRRVSDDSVSRGHCAPWWPLSPREARLVGREQAQQLKAEHLEEGTTWPSVPARAR